MKEAINFNNVNFSFDSAAVLEDVSFVINRGDFISILGPNGGGKTTLAKLMLGIYTPNSGKVLIHDKSPQHTRDIIGYVPQYSLFDPNFPVSVMDVVLMGRLNKKNLWFSRKDRAKAMESIEQIGMTSFTTTGFNELSGGQGGSHHQLLTGLAHTSLCPQPGVDTRAKMDRRT